MLPDSYVMSQSLNKHVSPIFPGQASSQLCRNEFPVSGMAVIGFRIQLTGINAKVGVGTS